LVWARFLGKIPFENESNLYRFAAEEYK